MKIIFVMIFYFCFLNLYSDHNTSLKAEISENNYKIDSSLYKTVILSVENLSDKDYVFWISKNDIVDKSKETLFRDFFRKKKCAECFSLMTMIYEGLFHTIPMVVGESFIKKLESNQTFNFIFMFEENEDVSVVSDFYKNKIVFVENSEFSQFEFESFDVFYPFDYLVLNANDIKW